MTLADFFRETPRAALAFSGGVDSAYLLYAGRQLGADLRPYCVKSAFQPAFERADVESLSRLIGVETTYVTADILAAPGVAENPADRCYLCKTALFSALRAQAAADGYAVLLDGTNASDDAGDRPGMRALKEMGVLSPLRLAGLTKAEIRRLSREAGLPTWSKPAYACLATRIPTGQPITQTLLRQVEGAETALAHMGYSDLRVRVFHGAARLQLPQEQLERAAAEHEAIGAALKPYFSTVLLDMEAR